MPHRALRNRVAHLVVDLGRIVYGAIHPDRSDAIGPDFDIVLVICAVSIGHTEERPMTASKIASYLGMPRTTVLRRLDALEARGIIERRGKRYYLTAAQQSGAERTLRRIVDMVDRLAIGARSSE